MENKRRIISWNHIVLFEKLCLKKKHNTKEKSQTMRNETTWPIMGEASENYV